MTQKQEELLDSEENSICWIFSSFMITDTQRNRQRGRSWNDNKDSWLELGIFYSASQAAWFSPGPEGSLLENVCGVQLCCLVTLKGGERRN